MDQLKILKVPGKSQIEIGGHVHTFTMRDYSHPEIAKVEKQIIEMHNAYPAI